MKAKNEEVTIAEIKTGQITVHVIGTTPLLLNRMSEKAKRQLLLPPAASNRASRAATLKHDPLEEYRASVYKSDGQETILALPSTSFKGAAMTAALDLPGSTKAQMGRLLFVVGQTVPVYGVPMIHSTVVRMQDAKRTPDIRTRAIIPQWAARFQIQFVQPVLNGQSVLNVIAASGITCGVGDFRQEKGKGNYGQFRIVDPKDKAFADILKTGGRGAQIKALDQPRAYDDETEELLGWFDTEVRRRGKTSTTSSEKRSKRPSKTNEHVAH